MTDTTQFATKQDMQDLRRAIVDDVGSMFSEAMNTIGANFQNLHNEVQELKAEVVVIRADVSELQLTVGRIERKLDNTIARVDQHDIEIKQLQTKLA